MSLLGMNIFSDHGSFILYPLSFMYRITSSPYALLALQSLTLSLGILPLLLLAERRGLGAGEALAAVSVYLLHPVLFSANLFDFHPETVGIPLIPLLFLCAEQRRYGRLILVAIVILSCKEVLSLTVSAIGLVLIVRRQRIAGSALAISGLAWFFLVTQLVMPGMPDGATANAFRRYSYLGETLGEKLLTLISQPMTVAAHLPLGSVALYLISLVVPCLWVFRRHTAVFLLACAPTLILNSISSLEFQRSLRFQHSLALVPIFAIMAIELLQSRAQLPRWWSCRRAVTFSILALIVPLVARNVVSYGLYPVHWASGAAVEPLERAVSLVPSQASVLASSRIVPHLSHRVALGLIDGEAGSLGLERYQYVVIDRRDNRDTTERELGRAVEQLIKASGSYEALLDLPEAALFRRKAA